MKGYKAFKKGMVCRGKQYAENTIFEEDEAVVCQKGMHFCKRGSDTLKFYDLVDDNGDQTEFAEVEALDEPVTDDGVKYCSKKLRIGARVSFVQIINEETKFDYESVKMDSAAKIGSSGYAAQIGSSGNSAKIGSSGDATKIGSSGDYAKIGSSGYAAQIGSSGDYAKIGSSGYAAKIGSSGYAAQIGSSGDAAQIGSSGDAAKIGSSGDAAKIGSSGNSAKIKSIGNNSVIMCAGANSIVKAKIGSWITLTEWQTIGGKSIPVCVKTEQVDGEKIKADTWYQLKDGEFIEVE